MDIFFDGVSTNGYIALYDDDNVCIASDNFHISWNESTKTISCIDGFLRNNSYSYMDIRNIVCVVWPGSFTGIRTVTLVVNTLAFIYPHIKLTWVNFFDMYDLYPIVKTSSKRDLFVKYNESDIIHTVKNEDFEKEYKGTYIYWDINTERFENNFQLNAYIDYTALIKDIPRDAQKNLSPLYFKKPNIT